jgi:hypothetical protein
MLQMTYFTGIAHTLKILQRKGIEAPLIDELWAQWKEAKECMEEAADYADNVFRSERDTPK